MERVEQAEHFELVPLTNTRKESEFQETLLQSGTLISEINEQLSLYLRKKPSKKRKELCTLIQTALEEPTVAIDTVKASVQKNAVVGLSLMLMRFAILKKILGTTKEYMRYLNHEGKKGNTLRGKFASVGKKSDYIKKLHVELAKGAKSILSNLVLVPDPPIVPPFNGKSSRADSSGITPAAAASRNGTSPADGPPPAYGPPPADGPPPEDGPPPADGGPPPTDGGPPPAAGGTFTPVRSGSGREIESTLQRIPMTNLMLGERIIRTVIRARYQSEVVVVKFLPSGDKFLIPYTLSMKGLVQVYGFVNDRVGTLGIVMESMEGDLRSLLKNGNFHFKWSRKAAIAREIASGLHYLHEHNILHCNISSQNILYNEDYHCKISGFGMARHVSDPPMESIPTQPFPYIAPELTNGSAGFSIPTDVYAFGVLLWEICTQKNPEEISPDNQSGNLLPTDDVPTEFVDLIIHCCATDPTSRPPFGEIKHQLDSLITKFKETGDISKLSLTQPP
eukprot:Phypoly_transcript_07123.p1 GENE.Phypoly_transcript_07123~~Phypoly_transcript_07123.p1  ORF type:complete len:544 (+),score=85.09 Phypoly_transcript_07123:113-1633(+)